MYNVPYPSEDNITGCLEGLFKDLQGRLHSNISLNIAFFSTFMSSFPMELRRFLL